MRMPWGKHRGQEIANLPASYLCWVLEECDNVNPFLRKEMREVLARRLDLESAVVTRYVTEEVRAGPQINLERAVSTWFRKLSLRWHPDRGGSDKAMQAINDAHDEIREALELRS